MPETKTKTSLKSSNLTLKPVPPIGPPIFKIEKITFCAEKLEGCNSPGPVGSAPGCKLRPFKLKPALPPAICLSVCLMHTAGNSVATHYFLCIFGVYCCNLNPRSGMRCSICQFEEREINILSFLCWDVTFFRKKFTFLKQTEHRMI